MDSHGRRKSRKFADWCQWRKVMSCSSHNFSFVYENVCCTVCLLMTCCSGRSLGMDQNIMSERLVWSNSGQQSSSSWWVRCVVSAQQVREHISFLFCVLLYLLNLTVVCFVTNVHSFWWTGWTQIRSQAWSAFLEQPWVFLTKTDKQKYNETERLHFLCFPTESSFCRLTLCFQSIKEAHD